MQKKSEDGKREEGMTRYDTEIDFNSKNTVTWLIDMIKDHTMVLEFGAASGRLTKYLAEKKFCEVWIVEIDQEAAREAVPYAKDYVIGDIMEYEWVHKFAGKCFDYIVFADVLEHLERPDEVLVQVKPFLKEEGKILISLPNIAYNGVLVSLYHNMFEYRETGILDRTHLHFWTLEEAVRMFRSLGYGAELVDAIYNPLQHSEFQLGYDSLPGVLADAVKSRAYGEIYQLLFVLGKDENAMTTQNILKHTDYLYLQIFFKGNDTDAYEEKKFPAELGEKICLEVQVPAWAKTFRLDPLNEACVARVKVLNQYDVELAADHTNGECRKDIFCFDHADAQIIYEIVSGTTKLKIQIDFLMYRGNEIYQWICGSLKEQSNIIEQKENYICEQREIIAQKEKDIMKQKGIIEQKENYICEQREMIAQKEKDLNSRKKKLEMYDRFTELAGIRQLYRLYLKRRSGELQ